MHERERECVCVCMCVYACVYGKSGECKQIGKIVENLFTKTTLQNTSSFYIRALV